MCLTMANSQRTFDKLFKVLGKKILACSAARRQPLRAMPPEDHKASQLHQRRARMRMLPAMTRRFN